MRNRLTEALAVGDQEKAKKCISSTYMALIAVILPVMLIGCVLFQFVDLNSFFNVSDQLITAEVLHWALGILFCGVCLSFVLKTVNVIIYALQKSSVNNMLSLCSSVLPLVYIAIFKGDSLQSNLISLTVVHIVAMNLPLLVATFAVFQGKTLRPVRPALKNCDWGTAKSMLGFGMQFFLAQIFFMFLISTNEIIITKIFSSEAVVEYSIYFRLFTVVGSLFMLALTPLWSKVTKDLAQGKYSKIQKTNRVLYALSVLAAIAEFAMVLILQIAVNIWLGSEAIRVDYITGFVFAFYGSMYVLNVVLTTVANGMGDLRTQIVFYGIGAVLKIPGIYALCAMFNHWRIVIFYNAIVLLVFGIFQLVWVEKYVKKKIAEKQENSENES